jgi:hypothetical protein
MAKQVLVVGNCSEHQFLEPAAGDDDLGVLRLSSKLRRGLAGAHMAPSGTPALLRPLRRPFGHAVSLAPLFVGT